MPGTILLTGFEPFGKWLVNPSWEIARRLDGEQLGNLRVVGRRLPISWDGTWPALQDAIAEAAPDAILMLGLAAGESGISVEAQGLNRCGGTPDNEGKQYAAPSILEGGEESLQCSLPVARIVERIRALGLPAEVSQDAGDALCNFVTYMALARQREMGQTMPTGFIHLPNVLAADVEDGLTLDEMGSAVSAAIVAVAEALEAGKTRV